MPKYDYTKTKMMGSSRAPGNSGIALLNDFELSTRAGRGSTDKPIVRRSWQEGPGVAIHCDLLCGACLESISVGAHRGSRILEQYTSQTQRSPVLHSWWEGGGEGCWLRPV